ncbi:hypothetical protein OAU50_03250 [Planctomycetota bacterium]|nr:hypothetical protein [Planctomycetota bacterium]
MNNDAEKPFALREPMRQLDAAFAIARKMKHSTGTVPEGMMEDINATLARVEKAFVLDYDALKPDIQKRVRKLIKNTKRLDHTQLSEHLPDISRSIRHLLNHVLMNSDLQLTITDELGEVPSIPTENFDIDPGSANAKFTPAKAVNSRKSPQRTASPKILYGAIVAVLCIMGASVAIFGPWNRPYIPAANNGPTTTAQRNTADNTPNNNDEPAPINPADYGYPERLDNALLEKMNPLEIDTEKLTDDQILGALLGIEYQISLAEPDRLELKYADLEARLRNYTKRAIDAEPTWRKGEIKPFLEAFIEFTRSEMELKVLDESAGADDRLLLSDMLYAAGGSRYSLAILYRVLAACTEAPIDLLAPNGPSRPVVGQMIGKTLHTFNGETFGARASAPKLNLHSLMRQTAVLLYPTMTTEPGRVLVGAWLIHFGVGIKIKPLRSLLDEFDAAWCSEPLDGNEADEELGRAANVLWPYMCDQLLSAGGNAEEALRLFQLATTAEDSARAEAALLALGERAEPGAMMDGEPLAWRIAGKFAEQKMMTKAVEWWTKTLNEFPKDPRPALKLSDHGPASERSKMLSEAYRRGDHSALVIHRLIDGHLQSGNQLGALALYDELCEESADPIDLQNCTLLCLEMGKVDWALERLSAHSETVATEPSLQRLELICELQANGLGERAQKLADAWRATNPDDPWLKNILERHGG